ncbi:MAG: prepilin-type N-terminal cleavage/methylation domain-containing protein [Planctomycetota bacterium]
MPRSDPRHKRAFSLIELVVVVVIIGVVAAIAIPRMSRGSEGAAESVVIADLAVMRNAIDLYMVEHIGDFPTSAGSFANQMTLFTNLNGDTSATKGAGFIYGPYLRAIPPLPGGPQQGQTKIKAPPSDGTPGFGWVYDAAAGTIVVNADDGEITSEGVPFNEL